MAKSNATAPKAARGGRPDIKAHSHKPTRRKPAPKSQSKGASKLPDLTTILHALVDARALVSVAHRAIAVSDVNDAEERVLRMGAKALDAVYDELDAADVLLSQFRRKVASTLGGAS